MHELLGQLLRGLVPHIIAEADHGNAGALWCAGHTDAHTRGGEAAFPMLYWGLLHGDAAWVARALKLAHWLMAQQNPDGSWDETPETWDGTTVFQLLALSAMVDTGRNAISQAQFPAFEKSIGRAADWVCAHIHLRSVTTNYVAGGAAALALSAKVLPCAKWKRAAKKMARQAAGRINAEGLVVGEGKGRRILKKIYIKPKGIDMGYGLEMTLGALGLYVAFAGQRDLIPLLDTAIRAHLDFIYPDGSLDNSVGSRGYKWTLYGSKTSHGSQMALGFAAPRIPAAARALERTVDHLCGYLVRGLLGDGPHVDGEQGVSCLYPTIMRACNLALTLAYFDLARIESDSVKSASVPLHKPSPVKQWKSLNSGVVHKGPWHATISGYDERTPLHQPGGGPPRYFTVPGGGSITYLFHEGWGPVQAATPLAYEPVEMHVPETAAPPESFTPRLIIHTASTTASSAMFPKPRLAFTDGETEIMVESRGGFRALDGGGLVRSTCHLQYMWTRDRLTKTYGVVLAEPCGAVKIIEPVVLPEGVQYTWDPTGLRLCNGTHCLTVRFAAADGLWERMPIVEAYCPLPSLRAVLLGFRCRPRDWQAVEGVVTFTMTPEDSGGFNT